MSLMLHLNSIVINLCNTKAAPLFKTYQKRLLFYFKLCFSCKYDKFACFQSTINKTNLDVFTGQWYLLQ